MTLRAVPQHSAHSAQCLVCLATAPEKALKGHPDTYTLFAGQDRQSASTRYLCHECWDEARREISTVGVFAADWAIKKHAAALAAQLAKAEP